MVGARAPLKSGPQGDWPRHGESFLWPSCSVCLAWRAFGGFNAHALPPALTAHPATVDGQRFVAVLDEAELEPLQIVVIPDFAEELKAKMAEAGQ